MSDSVRSAASRPVRSTGIPFFGIPFFSGSKAAFLSELESRIDAGERAVQIATVNPEFVVESFANPAFADILSRSSCVVDGQGIVFAERFSRHWGNSPTWLRFAMLFPAMVRFALKKPADSAFPEIIPGSELVYDLVELCARKGWTIAFVGGGEGVADTAAKRLSERYPNARFAYADSGFPRYDLRQSCVDELVRIRPDAIFVAIGSPKQERFIAEDLFPNLPDAKFAVGLGGTFDFIAGKVPRAPGFFRKAKLEWFYRLLKEPKLRYRRILRAVVTFPIEIAKRGRG